MLSKLSFLLGFHSVEPSCVQLSNQFSTWKFQNLVSFRRYVKLSLKMNLEFFSWIIFTAIFSIEQVNGFEWPAVPYQLFDSCKTNQSFDQSTLLCYTCPKNSVPRSDGKFFTVFGSVHILY